MRAQFLGYFIYKKMVKGIIIGNGDIATALREAQVSEEGPIRFLASGLSNSQNVTYADFKREKALIFKWGASERNHLVYFSSLCIYYSNSPYAQYKRDIEEYIKATCKSYTIVRIGNITWGKNPNTILNYFKRNPNATIEEGYRYLLDKEEFLHWMERIPNFNDTMNITGKLTSIKEIYERSVLR